MKRITDFLKRNYYLLTPVLMFFSFPNFDLFFFRLHPMFAWFALVPLLVYIREKKFKDLYFVTFGVSLLGHFLTYEWIGNFGAEVPGGYFVILGFLIPSLSVFFSVKILAAEALSRRFESLRFVIFPSFWIIVDWIQSIGFIAYPMPFWAYSQYSFLSFIQVSSITGVFGVTFLIVMFNTALSDLLYQKGPLAVRFRDLLEQGSGRRLGITAGILIAVVLYGTAVLVATKREVKSDLRVALVQTTINPWESWSARKFQYLTELIRYSKMALVEEPELLVWSESATLETISYNYMLGNFTVFGQMLFDFVTDAEVPLFTGEIGILEEWTENYIRRYPLNNAVLINKNGEVAYTYSKIHLVPFGEWFPYENIFPFVKRIVDSFGASSFVPGDSPELYTIKGKELGTLICYEGIFHRLCRRYRNLGADFYINTTNDGWTETYKGHMQHFASGVFRAIENGIWFVRCGNTGYTALVDPYGRVTQSIPILTKGYLVGDIDFSFNHRTVYSAVGDLVLYLSMVFIAVLDGIVLHGIIRRNR